MAKLSDWRRRARKLRPAPRRLRARDRRLCDVERWAGAVPIAFGFAVLVAATVSVSGALATRTDSVGLRLVGVTVATVALASMAIAVRSEPGRFAASIVEAARTDVDLDPG
jgi:hypothetical protein